MSQQQHGTSRTESPIPIGFVAFLCLWIVVGSFFLFWGISHPEASYRGPLNLVQLSGKMMGLLIGIPLLTIGVVGLAAAVISACCGKRTKPTLAQATPKTTTSENRPGWEEMMDITIC